MATPDLTYDPSWKPEGGPDLGYDPDWKPEASNPLRRFLADPAISLLKGVVGVPESAVGLADIVTGGHAGKFLENAEGDFGFRPKEAKNMLDSYYSPEQKAANEHVQNADGFIDTLGRIADKPSVIPHAILESLPVMGAGGVVSRSVAPLLKSAAIRGAIGEGVIGAGSAAEQVRQETKDGLMTLKQGALPVASGAGTFAFGALGGKLSNRLGIGDVENMLAGGAQKIGKKGMARSAAEGFITEGGFEEAPQSAWEQAMQNIALDRPWYEGVGNATALGAVTGGVMGAGAGGIGSLSNRDNAAPGRNPLTQIAGLLPAPVQTGVEGHDILLQDVARQNSMDAAQANADKIYAERDAYEAAMAAAFPYGLPQITEPVASVQEKIDEALRIDQSRLSPQEQANYVKTLKALLDTPVGIANDANGHEIPLTMGALLNSQATVETVLREQRSQQVVDNATEQAQARNEQVASEESSIPVVGPLSAASDMAVKNGAAQVAAQATEPAPEPPAPPVYQTGSEEKAGTYGDGGTGKVVVKHNGDGGFHITTTWDQGIHKKSTGSSFPAGTDVNEAIAQMAAKHGGFAAEEEGQKQQPDANTGGQIHSSSGTYRDGGRWKAEYKTVKRTDGSVSLVRTITDDDGVRKEHLSAEGEWVRGEPAKTTMTMGGPGHANHAAESFMTIKDAADAAIADSADMGATSNTQTESTEPPTLPPESSANPAVAQQQAQTEPGPSAPITNNQPQATSAPAAEVPVQPPAKAATQEGQEPPSSQATPASVAPADTHNAEVYRPLVERLIRNKRNARELGFDIDGAISKAKEAMHGKKQMPGSFRSLAAKAEKRGDKETAEVLRQIADLNDARKNPPKKAVLNSQATPDSSPKPVADVPSLQRPPASWVIKNKATGEVILETYDKKKVDAINAEKYEAIPILEHLQSINKDAKYGKIGATPQDAVGVKPIASATLTSSPKKEPSAVAAAPAVSQKEKAAPTPNNSAKPGVPESGMQERPAARAVTGSLEEPAQSKDGAGSKLNSTAFDAFVKQYVENQPVDAFNYRRELSDLVQEIEHDWNNGNSDEYSGKFGPDQIHAELRAENEAEFYDTDGDLTDAGSDRYNQIETALSESIAKDHLNGPKREQVVLSRPKDMASVLHDFLEQSGVGVWPVSGSGKSSSQYFEIMVNGEKRKVRVSDHALPVEHSDANGAADYEVMLYDIGDDLRRDGRFESEGIGEDEAIKRAKSFIFDLRSDISTLAGDVSNIDAAANEAATSPQNDTPLPTDAQKSAGNYKMGHVIVHGLDITIENPKGSERSGIDADGRPWKNTMASHYGYILGTDGNDGDHVDVFVGDNPESEQVFIVDQKNVKTGAFDEHKVLLGFNSLKEAKAGYANSYQKGWMLKGVIGVTPATLGELKAWLSAGDMKSPYSNDEAPPAETPKTETPPPKTLPERVDAAKEKAATEKADKDSSLVGHKVGDLVKLTKPGVGGRVNIAGTIKKILPGGRFEIKTQSDGYMIVHKSELGHKPAAEVKPNLSATLTGSPEVERKKPSAPAAPEGWNDAVATAQKEWARYDRGQRSMLSHQSGFGNAVFGKRKQTLSTMEWNELPPNAQRAIAKIFLVPTAQKGSPAQAQQTRSNVAPIMRRNDLVGAIMRVTGGNGIASSMSDTLIGEKANRVGNLRGLFTNRGQQDMGDIAMLLREEEGFDVKDGPSLEELIREAASGNVAKSMSAQKEEKAINAEKEHRQNIREEAARLGIKSDFKKFDILEREVLARQAEEAQAAQSEAEAERAAIQAESAVKQIDDDQVNELLQLAVEDGRMIGNEWITNEEILAGFDATTAIGEREDEAGASRTGEGSAREATGNSQEGSGQARAEVAPALTLEGQTLSEVNAQEKKRQADEAAAQRNDAPKGPNVTADQVDLFNTQGGLFNSNRDSQEEKAQSAPAPADNARSDASLERSKARNDVRFETPYVGKDGVSLVGYVWPNKKEEYIDARGEDRVRIVSDWEAAVQNLETGRQIVHQFAVRKQDGTEQDVSAETAAVLLGVSESTVRSNAKKLLEKEIARAKNHAKELAYADKVDDIHAQESPALAVDNRAMTYSDKAPMVERIAKSGKGWSEVEDRIERESAASEKYRFLKKDGNFIWSPDLVSEGSELFNRGWRNVELTAREIWPVAKQPDSKGSDGIRYNVADDGTETLIIQHNLSAENLLHAQRMGGIPVPSLAITEKGQTFSSFGEITLLGSKRMADPKGYAGTKVFGADIYSPRYPTVKYITTQNMRKRAEAMIKDGLEATNSNIEWGNVADNGIRELASSPALRWKFLKDRGIEPKIIRVEAKQISKELLSFKDDDRSMFDLERDKDFIAVAYEAHENELVKAYAGDVKAAAEEIADIKSKSEERGVSYLVRESARQLNQYRMDSVAQGKVDKAATNLMMESQIYDSGLRDEMDQYAAEFLQSINPDEKIFQGYTYAGKQRYTPHTLENVVKILKKELRGGEGFNYGVGSIRSAFTPQFRSIDQIRKAKNRLMDKAGFDAVKEEIDQEFFALAEDLAPYHSKGGDFGFGDTLSSMMYDAAKMGIPKAMRENGFEVAPTEKMKKVSDFLNKLRTLPTQYFEAKILRDVDLAEFSGAVVPEGVNPKALEALKARGVTNIRTYKKGNETDRAKAVEKLADDLHAEGKGTIFNQANDGRITPADKAIYGMAAEGKSAQDILKHIASTSRNPFYRQLARILLKTGIAPKITVGDGKGFTFNAGNDKKYAASYNPKTDTVSLFRPASSERHVLHELTHAATIKALSKKGMASVQMRALFNHVKTTGKLHGMYGMENVDEFVAEAFSNPKFQEALKAVGAPSGSTGLKGAWEWFVRIVGGILGLKKVDHNALSAALEIGVGVMHENMRLSEGKNLTTKGNVGAGSTTINVDGVERSRLNSNGKPIAQTDEGIRNFWKWFAGSKVTDDQGRPLVIYHGTAESFSYFDEAQDSSKKDHGYLGRGFYFSTNPVTAGSYANMKSGIAHPNIMPLYSALKNPLLLSMTMKETKVEIVRKSLGLPYNLTYEKVTPSAALEVTGKAKELGYDGVYLDYSVFAENGGVNQRRFESEKEVVAFDPSQIKSASGNNGQFSPDNNDIRYNLTEQAGNQLFDLLHTDNKFNALHKTIATQYHKSTLDKDFKRVFDVGQKFLLDNSRFAMDAADQAPSLLQKLGSLADVFKKGPKRADIEAIAAPIFTGTLDKVLYTDAQLRSVHNLSDPQIALYREFRAGINKSLDDLGASEMARIAKPLLSPAVIDAAKSATDFDTATSILHEALLDHAREAMSQADRARESGDAAAAKKLESNALEAEKTADDVLKKAGRIRQLKQEGYAPLMRFGNYAVDVTKTGEDGEVERIYFGMYETQREANMAARAFRAEYPDANVEQGPMDTESWKLFGGVDPSSLEVFADAVGADESPIFQEYLRLTLNNRSALKRLIKREGIAGFSKDVTRVLSQFVTSNARLSSKNYHFGDMKKAVMDIPKMKGDVKNEAAKLATYLQNPNEEAAGLRGYLFIHYLGGSIASALTNMTQPITMTLPYLAQFGGAARAGAALVKAGKLYASGSYDAELAEAMALAEREGITAPHEIHQLYAESERGLGRNIWVRKGLRAWGAMFSLAESYNRNLTFISAFNMARTNGHENPFAFAQTAIEDTQGIYNKGNRPDWARGTIGATVFTFKQFSISYIEFISRLYKNDKKAFALAMAIMFMGAGAEGWPFAEDVEDLIDTIGQLFGHSTNSKQWVRQQARQVFGDAMGEFVRKGASAIPGMPIDISGRIGVSNLIPGTAMFKVSETDKARDVFDFIGPVGGLAQSAVSGFDSLRKGDAGAAVRLAAPLAIQNIAKGGDMLHYGAYRDRGGRKVVDTTPVEAFSKAIGFHPNTVAKESSKVRELQQNINQQRRIKDEIADKWAAGIFDKDPEAIREAQAELMAWNLKNPESRIGIAPQQISTRLQAMYSTREQRFIKSAPKEMRGQVLKEIRN